MVTSLEGASRIKSSGKCIKRHQVSAECFESSAAIDIFNHVRTGGVGMEDSWKTMSPKLRQFAALLGFVASNAFLAYQFFKDKNRTCKF